MIDRQRHPKTIADKNIRATSFEEFWGQYFNESIYLWEGSKHQIPLERWYSDKNSVLPDRFSSKKDICLTLVNCRYFYSFFLAKLSNCLNKIHHLNFPTSFWEIVLGSWLYQCICLLYDKYAILSTINLDRTDIKLLEKDSFYIPADYTDFFACFHSDFGVQQIVSHYYYLFSKQNFSKVRKEYPFKKVMHSNFINYKNAKNKLEYIIYQQKLLLSNFYQRYVIHKNNPKIALIEAYYHYNFIKKLKLQSRGKIAPIALPVTLGETKKVSLETRQILTQLTTDGVEIGSFEHFFWETLFYSLPKGVVENFSQYYFVFSKDIKSKKFTHLVSEGWIGKFKIAIYVAIAKQQGIKLIVPEHGAFHVLFKGNPNWYYSMTADTFLTTGWKPSENSDVSNFKSTGFASRKVINYKFQSGQKSILYVTSSNPPYQGVYGREALFNTFGVRSLKTTLEFMDSLPKYLKDNFVLRLRRYPSAWDTANAWQVEGKGIKLDNLEQNLQTSICNSKIVVIDHLSTSLAEILAMNAPFILIHDERIKCICDEYINLLNSLKEVGILHTSGKSAALYLNKIYDRVENWWFNQTLQTSLNNFKSTFIQDESKVAEYLLSLIN